MDIVDQLMKQVKKDCQKIKIQAMGMKGEAEQDRFQVKVEKDSDIEVEAGMSSLSKNSSELKEAIQGQFGKQVTKIFDQQEKMLDKL